MPDYRRYFVPGGTYFFTLVTYHRRPLFAQPVHVRFLREAAASVQRESPFRFLAAVVLPEHMHFVRTLPAGDCDYSSRIGRMKVRFTRQLPDSAFDIAEVSESRRKHHESNIWQRRFWEHTIDDESELHAFVDYIHYNPVKHGVASCPHAWSASSFRRWVALGHYKYCWGCSCRGKQLPPRTFAAIEGLSGEPNNDSRPPQA
jgi:putative transposase